MLAINMAKDGICIELKTLMRMKLNKVFGMLFIWKAIECQKVQRLVLPTSASKLRIIPSVEMPMVSSNSIQSGFSFKLPIAINFPSATDFVQSIRQTVNDANSVQANFLDSNVTRVNSRANLFKTIEKSHNRFGRVCLLRAICEVAEVPFMSASHGLLGQLVDMLLTSTGLDDKWGLLKIYREAELVGKSGTKGDKCKAHFKGCPLSLFNVIDTPFNV